MGGHVTVAHPPHTQEQPAVRGIHRITGLPNRDSADEGGGDPPAAADSNETVTSTDRALTSP